MLRNRIFIKKIRNICILVMAIIIAIGIYTYVRRSRAENVIQVELEVSDKSETLAMQKVRINATETEDGNFILDLPTAVNGNIVMKYYLADGTEIVMNDENADKTLTLTEADVTNQPIQFQTDYDKKEVTTEDGQVITLYNKELMDEKKTEETTNNESSEGNLDNETANQTENQMEDQTANQTENQMEDQTANQPENQTENQTADQTENQMENQTASETVDEENTDEELEFDDTVIVTGYMPLEAQVDVNEIDLSTLPEMTLPETQTVQKAYEVSIYQTIRRIIDANDNMISEETIMPDKLLPDETTQNAINNETENNIIVEDTTNNINEIIESITSENAKENENVESVTETTTSNNTTITTILLKDGTRIEEEKIEYNPNIYNEQITVKTKNIVENTMGTIYALQEDNQLGDIIGASFGEYIDAKIQKDSKPIKYIYTTQQIIMANTLQSDETEISTMATEATGEYNYLIQENTSATVTSFLWNDAVQRKHVENVTFLDNLDEMNDTAWDVSAAQDGSIMAWYEYVTDKTYRVYIGSNEEIYANPNSTNLFTRLAQDECTYPELVTNIELLNTSQVTNMSYMFASIGGQFGWRDAELHLDLGTNFDTSKVTNMYCMFLGAEVSSLNLGTNFDTSQVTNMGQMFSNIGDDYFTYLNLGTKFDTSNVTNMTRMFYAVGHNTLKTLDLGPLFTKISTSNTAMFSGLEETTFTLIVPKEIYSSRTQLKLGESSSTTISIPTATIKTFSYLMTTNTENDINDPVFGNTSLRRQDIFSLTFVDSLSLANSTAWDVSEAQDGSIKAWYEPKLTASGYVYNLYIGSNDCIYANSDSRYLFYHVGAMRGTDKTKQAIVNIDLLYTSRVTDMSYMFSYAANEATEPIDLGYNFDTSSATNMEFMFNSARISSLGDEFDTSNVTNMYYMFRNMVSTSLTDLGDKFDTSNVTNMAYMFHNSYFENLDLGDNFDTSNATNMDYMFTSMSKIQKLDLGDHFNTSSVTSMNGMFSQTGRNTMTKLDLGKSFTNIINTNIFNNTGKENECIIYVPEEIYIDEHHVKLNETSSTQIEYTRGTFNITGQNYSYLRNTSSENVQTSGFLGNTSIQRQNIDNVTFVNSLSGANSTAWDVSEKQDGSIKAWYTTNSNGTYKVYIGSDNTIYANPDSRQLFTYIGYSNNCTSTETITNLNLLDTSKVTNMAAMFYYTGYSKMTNLDLGANFDTSNVTDMHYMFYYTGYNAMTSLDLGDNFDTSNVTDMSSMFALAGHEKLTSVNLGEKFNTSNVTNMAHMFNSFGYATLMNLDLGDKFNTSKVTDMTNMFWGTGYNKSSARLDLGPAFINIASTNTMMFHDSFPGIQVPEAIFSAGYGVVKLNANSNITINLREDRTDTIQTTLNPLYRTEWVKQSVKVTTTGSPNVKITLKGTVINSTHITNLKSTLTTNDIKIYIDNEEVTGITKTLGTATETTNTETGGKDILQVLTLPNLEQATFKSGKNYKDWSGNIRLEIAQGTLSDTTSLPDENGKTVAYGNGNMDIASSGERIDNVLEDNITNKNTSNILFADVIKPTIKYEYSETDIDHDGKSFTMEFSITDKYMSTGALTINSFDIKIGGETPDWTEIDRAFSSTPINATVNGSSKVVGYTYKITLSNLEQLQIKEGDKYLDYSGVVTVAIAANQIRDTSGNGNNATSITSGISLPGGTGTEEVVDVVKPLVEKVESSIDVDAKTATIKFRTTDKYITQNNPLENGDIQVLVNGSANTSITKTINNTALTEQRTQNGTTSTVQYGYEYTLTLSGINTTVNQIKVRIPAGAVTDQSGNGNELTDLMLLNTLKSTSTEQYADSGFLGNSLGMMQRQNIENITFVNHIPEDVYDVSTNTYKNNNAWDASAQGDNSIIAWYEQNENDALKVYIGSNDEIFANTNSSYLFSYVGSSYNCTSTEMITNIELLNTSNVTNMNHMFSSTGYVAMTSLDLGSNFDTSNVTDMSYMFNGTGIEAMTSLDLGDKFDTSKVTNMTYMFVSTGRQAMINLALGDNFDTSSVTNMTNMFDGTGYDEMTSLDLGDKFDTSSVTNMSYMFSDTGYTKMTSLDLGDKFDTTNVQYMDYMFRYTGCQKMTKLDLGDKFNTSNVTNMRSMFESTGYGAMTSLDLGPAFTNIASTNSLIFETTGKENELVVYAPEAIYYDSIHFRLNSENDTLIGFSDMFEEATNRGTIEPKYRTEWIKESASIDTSDANNPKINITIRGTTNPDVPASEYASNVTSTLANTDIKVYIDGATYTSSNITDSATIAVGTATTTTNTRTGAQDVLQTITITNFEQAERLLGKTYKEYSGNIRLEIAQGTLTDTTNANDTTITYGNSNVSIINDGTGTRTDSTIEDETKVDKNTTGAMFADFIKPEFTYIYSSTDINYDQKTLTVTFSVVDKFFNSTTGLTNADGITVKMIDENVVPENLTKTITKTRDITEIRNNTSIKVGEEYTLTVTGFEQAQMAEDGKYKDYSGPVSIAFPAGIVSDKSGNTNIAKTITVGINEPDGTGEEEIVDFVKPTWKAENLQVDTENKEATVDLIGTDKYFESGSLDVSQIKVIVDGEEVTDTTSVIKELSTPISLTETRDGASVQYGVKYTLTLNGWKQTDEAFQASEKRYREYSGNTQIIIEEGTLIDESGNESDETTLNLGFIDVVDPEVYQISVTKNVDEKTDTIIFDVVDKYFASSSITTTNTEGLTVYVDDEEAIGVTKTIVDIEDITATVNGSEKKIGERYTLVLSNFEQERTTPVDYDREYSDWSGTVTVKVAPGLIEDSSGNTNQEVLDVETISKDTEYIGYYADIDGNGSVDGVIYADLAVGKSGTWGYSNGTGTYSYATETGLKEYYISQTNYTGDFGTKDVITELKGSGGKDRFYVIALEDVNDGNGPHYTWYDAAYGQMNDYATATSTDFGAGKTNTATILAKWKASAYGSQNTNPNNRDMWGAIQSEVEKGWFVLSISEWAAFGDNLNIERNNYANYGLSGWSWASSQYSADSTWGISFNYGYVDHVPINHHGGVRLGTTF